MGKFVLDEELSKLHHLITNKKDGGRYNEIEKQQLEILKGVLASLQMSYGKQIIIDYSRFNTHTDENTYRICYDGIIRKGDYKTCGNRWYDSKSFDAIIDIIIGGKQYSIFFVLKSAQVPGGNQDNAIKEIGMYTKLMQSNQDENASFMFILDGEYINKHVNELDKCDKYYVSTSETVESNLRTFINSKL